MRVQQSSTFSEEAKSIAFEGGCKERAKYPSFWRLLILLINDEKQIQCCTLYRGVFGTCTLLHYNQVYD